MIEKMDGNLYWLEKREREEEKWLNSRPVCGVCGEPIQDEKCADAYVLSQYAKEFTADEYIGKKFEKLAVCDAVCIDCYMDIADAIVEAFADRIEEDCVTKTSDFISPPDDF